MNGANGDQVFPLLDIFIIKYIIFLKKERERELFSR